MSLRQSRAVAVAFVTFATFTDLMAYSIAVPVLPDLARRLGKSDGATRVLVFRLRNRFRRLIRTVLADTVGDLDQVETELRHLGEVLRDC